MQHSPTVDFDIAPVKPSIIMCVGVGGGGGNAVRHMFKLGIADVTFVVCNTDRQALEDSPVPIKIRLGDQLTGGLGAGNKPERGRQAAMESIEQIKDVFVENDTKMLFVTAGMGGGTGTGAAPVIAQAAKEMGILTVGIVSIPFKTEGRKRIEQAIAGIEEISKYVDSLLVIDNESINEIHGDLTLSDAFGKADDILATAAKSIADIITSHFQINVDFEDVRTVMQNSGVALMGSAIGSGDNRALEVATNAMSSPLLNHKDISGAQNVLLNITSGTKEVTLRETYEITQYIQERAGNNNATDLIWGAGKDESLGDNVRVTVIATGFDMDSIPAIKEKYKSTLTPRGQFGNRQHDPSAPTRVNLEDPVEQPKQPRKTDDDEFQVVTRGDGGSSNSYQQQQQYSEPAPEIRMPERIVVEDQPAEREVKAPQQTPPAPQQGHTRNETIRTDNDNSSPLVNDNIPEENLNTPAWMRRGVELDPLDTVHRGQGQRTNLQTEKKPEQTPSNLSLFDE